jgi:hypothetical protein
MRETTILLNVDETKYRLMKKGLDGMVGKFNGEPRNDENGEKFHAAITLHC